MEHLEQERLFIRAWQLAPSMDAAQRQLGWTLRAVQAMANRLRYAGVRLRRFRDRISALSEQDVRELNDLVDALDQGIEEQYEQ